MPFKFEPPVNGVESQIATRRLREAVLSTDGGWLADANARIAALRATLT